MQKLSMVDFNCHISCTLFTSGCNFACPFCHNSSLVYNEEKEISEIEIFNYLCKRQGIIDSVVISGGEPTLYPDLPDFIRKLKNLNLLIKLDTNGTNPDMIKYLYENNLIDYVAMDIKNSLSDYDNTIGTIACIDKIKTSINYIMTCGIDYEFRTTLVQEFHNTTNIKNIAKEIAGAKKYYLQKFVDSGHCISSDLHEVPKAEAEKYLNILKETIPNTSLRGY